MYDVYEAMPFRLRSNSIAAQNPTKTREKNPNNLRLRVKRRRYKSLECLYLEENHSSRRSTKSNCIEKKFVKNTKSKFSVLLSDDENEISSQNFCSRDIQAPKIYVMGTSNHKISSKSTLLNKRFRFEEEEKYEGFKKPYARIESKLAPYLLSNRERVQTYSYSNTGRSQTAIQHHSLSSNPFVIYKNQANERSSYLKLSKSLDSRIREDLHINRGPIYFAELNKDNLEAHNKYKSGLELKDKFMTVFEWLGGINENECFHFYSNPFKSNKQVNTDDVSKIDSTKVTSENFINEKVASIGFLANKKLRIDPFDNPKNEMIIDKLPTKRNSGLRFNSYFETNEKQTLAANQDYTKYLHLDKKFTIHGIEKHVDLINKTLVESKEKTDTLNSQNYSTVKDRLRKQKSLNDVLLTRMQLDLFVL